jgi:hypothetical protein
MCPYIMLMWMVYLRTKLCWFCTFGLYRNSAGIEGDNKIVSGFLISLLQTYY